MRIVVVGASGNVGTSVLDSLSKDPQVESIVGIARRAPAQTWPKTSWVAADISQDELVTHFRGADVVIHLAWLIQPSHDLQYIARTNVFGSARLFEAVAEAGVSRLVYASSIGAYSPGPKDWAVDETWPTDGIESSFYSRHKAEVERLLDRFEEAHPEIAVVRLRPALIFKKEAASGIRRLFFGPLLPSILVRKGFIPLVPDLERLRFQTVHSYDVGDAYRLAAMGEARGAFNIAADPVLDPDELSDLFDARKISIPPALLRNAMKLTWRLHLQPSPSGWLDMGLETPIMNVSKAREELGWKPRYSSKDALVALVEGLQQEAGLDTPPLSPHTSGPLRVKEFLTGIGRSGA